MDIENKLRELTVAGGGKGWGEGIIREFRVDMHTLLYLKWVTNKDHTAHGTLLNLMWQPG